MSHVYAPSEPKRCVLRLNPTIDNSSRLDVGHILTPRLRDVGILDPRISRGGRLALELVASIWHASPLIEVEAIIIRRVHSESLNLLHSPGSSADRALADVVGGAHLADELVPGIVVGCGVGGTHSSVDGGLDAVLHPVPLVSELVIGHIGTGYGCRDRVPDGRIGVVEHDGALQIAVRIGIRQVARIVGLLTQLRRDLI